MHPSPEGAAHKQLSCCTDTRYCRTNPRMRSPPTNHNPPHPPSEPPSHQPTTPPTPPLAPTRHRSLRHNHPLGSSECTATCRLIPTCLLRWLVGQCPPTGACYQADSRVPQDAHSLPIPQASATPHPLMSARCALGDQLLCIQRVTLAHSTAVRSRGVKVLGCGGASDPGSQSHSPRFGSSSCHVLVFCVAAAAKQRCIVSTHAPTMAPSAHRRTTYDAKQCHTMSSSNGAQRRAERNSNSQGRNNHSSRHPQNLHPCVCACPLGAEFARAWIGASSHLPLV